MTNLNTIISYITARTMDVKLQTVIIFGIITKILGWRPFIVKCLNESYEINYPEIFDFNLTIKNQTFVDVQINVLRDIPQIFVDLEVTHDSGDAIYDLVYMNKTIDLCIFLNNKKLNVFFDIAYRMLSDYGDLPQKCPIRKKRYEFLNVYVNPEKLPPLMPDHKAKVSAIWWNKQKDTRNILMKFEIHVVIERSFKNNGN